MATLEMNGETYYRLVSGGEKLLSLHEDEVNDLNVFPIPDGDTGKNMKMTLAGGLHAASGKDLEFGKMADKIASGMLLSARGNSGVILSQFFAGLAEGFAGCVYADVKAVAYAFECGVKRAYSSVITPTEGTILTVVREATNYAKSVTSVSLEDFFKAWLKRAKEALANTPNQLAVLKEANVVDSGGAGIVYIVEGMYKVLLGQEIESSSKNSDTNINDFNPDLFTSDMDLEFGYCTEVLVRLQNSKCDVENLDANIFIDYLKTIGNSIVCFKTGSIIKIHVHTFYPYKVLQFAQQYGEFLTIKIENMMLQNQEIREKDALEHADKKVEKKARHEFGVVTVASGSGVKDAFLNFGCDVVIDGGQTMNPSSEDFIKAFDYCNADNIFVFPNNSNIIMAANQAAQMYEKSKVFVIPTKNLGQAYASLSMIDFTSDNVEEIKQNFIDSMDGVETIEISKATRDASLNGVDIKENDYIAILDKEVVSSSKTSIDAAFDSLKHVNLDDHGVLLIVVGKNGYSADAQKLVDSLKKTNPYLDVEVSLGQQDVYDYILICE